MNSMRPLRALPLLFAVVIASAQGLAPTQAWRQTFDVANNSDNAYGIVTDAQGNAYFQFTDHYYTNEHLVKIGPAQNVVFHIVNPETEYFSSYGVLLSPMIGGQQYVYALDQSSNIQTGLSTIWIKKYTTNGVAQWNNAPFIFGSSNHPASFAGAYADTAGNLYLALNWFGFLDMMKIDANGNLLSEAKNSEIMPFQAYYDLHLNKWLVAGEDRGAAQPDMSARWGLYDPVTGARTTGQAWDGTVNYATGAFDRKFFAVFLLPNLRIAVAASRQNGTTGGPIPITHSIRMIENDGITTLWTYPTSGPAAGRVMDIQSSSASLPLYVVGYQDGSPQWYFAEQFDWNGNLIWRHDHGPTQVILSRPDGFYSGMNSADGHTFFLEKANPAGTFTWGKTYNSNPNYSNVTPLFGGFAAFQNSIFAMCDVVQTTNYDVILDRFVDGICFQNITCASTVQGAHALPVTILLNANAPAGGTAVGLNSSSPKLLMPNGTQAQLFTVPAGQSSIIVNLNAQVVAGTTGATLLAISNGIRRTKSVAITL